MNASNVDQLLKFIDCEEILDFELCGGLFDNWKEDVQGLDASGPKGGIAYRQFQVDEQDKIHTFDRLISWTKLC